MIQSPCFIISSVIYYKDKPLSYSQVRSYYTPVERASQTVRTIETIREKVPSAQIILFESGIKAELPCDLEKLVDHYLYIGDRSFVRRACDSPYKGLGEAVSILAIRKWLIKQPYDYFFKISGRYSLTDQFSIHQWGEQDCLYGRVYNNNSLSTRLYGLPRTMLNRWFRSLFLSIPFLLMNHCIESTLHRFIGKNKIHALPTLGVAGNVAPNAEFLDE